MQEQEAFSNVVLQAHYWTVVESSKWHETENPHYIAIPAKASYMDFEGMPPLAWKELRTIFIKYAGWFKYEEGDMSSNQPHFHFVKNYLDWLSKQHDPLKEETH